MRYSVIVGILICSVLAASCRNHAKKTPAEIATEAIEPLKSYTNQIVYPDSGALVYYAGDNERGERHGNYWVEYNVVRNNIVAYTQVLEPGDTLVEMNTDVHLRVYYKGKLLT